MESRKRASHSSKSGVEEKLDKLAEDIKRLPEDRRDKLKELIGKRAYSPQDAATQLGISLSTMRRFLRSGIIAFFRVGNRIRIDSNEIERFGNTINLKEAADILGVHKLTVTRLIKSGKLPAHRIGRPYRIAISDLELFMQHEIPKKNN